MSERHLGNREISAHLQEVALLLELRGENPFKVKAYSNAARSIEVMEEDLRTMAEKGRLKEIKGIGESIANHIAELVNTGRLGKWQGCCRSVCSRRSQSLPGGYESGGS